MTTIALFGATGKTGRRVLVQALDQGMSVRALARNPDKIAVVNDRLTVIRGDVLDPAAVDRVVAGSDAVISVVGHVKGSPADVQARGTLLIVDAMRSHGGLRIVTLSGGRLQAEGKDHPKLADHVIRVLLKLLSGHVLADAQAHLGVLQHSALECLWCVARA